MSLRNILSSNNSTTIKDKLDEFIKDGGDINERHGRDEQTFLMTVILGQQIDVAKILAEHPKTNVNVPDEYGATALHAAASVPNMLPIVKLLVARGGKVNAQDVLGETPLHMAALANEKDIIQYLVENGANKSIKSKQGQTPYDVAEEKGHDTLYDLLRVEEANISEINGNSVYNLNNNNRNRSNNNNGNSVNTNNGLNALYNMYRNPYPTKKENRYIVIKDKIPVYDFEAGEEVQVTFMDTLEDKANIYFKATNTYFRIPREVLQAGVNDNTSVQFECTRELHGAPTRENLVFNRPYYLIRGLSNFLVSLPEVLGALHATEENSYAIKEEDGREALRYVASYKSIIRDYTGLGLNGSQVNITSADHCQEGSTRKLYKLIPFYFVKDEPANNNSNNNSSNNNAPTNGGRRRKNRATKKLKRSKRSTRRRR